MVLQTTVLPIVYFKVASPASVLKVGQGLYSWPYRLPNKYFLAMLVYVGCMMVFQDLFKYPRNKFYSNNYNIIIP